MATNRKAIDLQKEQKVEYEWGTLWPHYHKEKMNWATGFRTKGDVDILFLSGSTGRDPFEDGPCRTPDEERAGKGKVVGGIKEQTRQTLEDIKNSLELMVPPSNKSSCSGIFLSGGKVDLTIAMKLS